MVTPTPDGVRNPIVLAAAAVGGVDRVWAIGGAQAVGALAYGTETIAAVDKIVGRGNTYVAAAKRRVFGTVGIDMIADRKSTRLNSSHSFAYRMSSSARKKKTKTQIKRHTTHY